MQNQIDAIQCDGLLAPACKVEHHGMMNVHTDNLTGKMLIAMPQLNETCFGQAVILVCSHDENGAMGLIINMPLPEITFASLLSELNIAGEARDISVNYGGPVETSRGFVLHSADYQSDLGHQEIDARFSITPTIDVLEDLVSEKGPAKAVLVLGYAGWAAGQLEGEIADNGWLLSEADEDIVFSKANKKKWAQALALIGVKPEFLSSEGGRA